jgi:hypothetical protein
LRNAADVPVSPATVRGSFPADDATPPVVNGTSDGDRAARRKRRAALIGACVLAFVVGFAGMIALTRATDGAKGASSPHPKTTQPTGPAAAPAAPASSPAKTPSSAPPSSALVSEIGNGPQPAPQSAPSMPRTDNAGPPAPSTTTPAPSTTTPATSPSTTTP